MTASRLILDSQNHRGEVDPRIFGGFLEHLGRAVYGGVFQPGHPKSNAKGFRLDVIERLRPLGFPMVRWPGGNYVSAWNWLDSIGPAASRPTRLDSAWKSLETNAFGMHEFIDWCREIGTDPLFAINLGTQGAQEAANLIEYANVKGGTHWSDLRRKNGAEKPFDVKLWCLGNEMDGPWQAGYAPAEHYGWKARQAGHLMKQIDPSIEVIAAGSCGKGMPTYMEWDRTVLEIGHDVFDHLAAHRYAGVSEGDRAAFLAEGDVIEQMIADFRSVIGYVAARKKTKRSPTIAFDEWNVWYRARGGDGGWKQGPALLEEHYDHGDALVVAQFLNAFLRNADVVKIGCLAQIANVIAPILVEDRGVLTQSIWHPIARLRAGSKGRSLVPLLDSPEVPAGKLGVAKALDASAIFDEATGELNLHVVNRSGEAQDLSLVLRDLAVTNWSGEVLASNDLDAKNTWEKPEAVKPVPFDVASLLKDGQVRIPAYGFLSLKGNGKIR